MQYTKAYVEKQGDSFVGVASTADIDRHGESIEVSGWDLKNFKKAPRILWAHDHTIPAIGTAKRVWTEQEKDSNKSKLMFKFEIHEITQLAREIKEMLKEGIINTFSVGFQPKEMDEDGATFVKQELLEVSVVNVPANPESVMLAYKAMKADGFTPEQMQKGGINPALVEMIESLSKKIDLVEVKAESAVKGLASLNPHRSKQEGFDKRQQLLKRLSSASSKLNSDVSNQKKAQLAKTIKLASEKLNHLNKQDYGTN